MTNNFFPISDEMDIYPVVTTTNMSKTELKRCLILLCYENINHIVDFSGNDIFAKRNVKQKLEMRLRIKTGTSCQNQNVGPFNGNGSFRL